MEDTKNTETTKTCNDSVNNNVDFWKDSQEFLKTQLPSDYQDKLKEYVIEKGYNENEFRLFRAMLEDGIGFHSLTFHVKYYC